MSWASELVKAVYDVVKKSNNSRAQKRARKEAEAEVYTRLLSSGLLMDMSTQYQRLAAEYLDHLNAYHGGGKQSMTANDELLEDSPPPPPPHNPKVTIEAAQPLARTTRERQIEILRAYGGD